MEKKSILLIEDKGIVGSLIRDVLIATGRYEVVYVQNGLKALERIIGDNGPELPSDVNVLEDTIRQVARTGLAAYPAARKFHLVLSDIRMPEIDGISTAKLIKMLYPNQVFAFITGYGIEDKENEIGEITPSVIIRKPLTNKELIEAIDEVFTAVIPPSGSG